MNGNETSISHRPVELLQQLIRYNTTNPPGNEAQCIQYIASLLKGAGIAPTFLAKDPDRPNLVARIPGRGEASPLLVYAHIDVVPTENQIWKYPPFEAQIADGCIWGRGALDDKNGVAISTCAFLRMKEEGWSPAGDVILAIVSDEERGGDFGSKYLIEEHPDIFSDVQYAIGEAGGFTSYIGKQKFYPIMLAEKQYCVLNLILRAPAQYATALVKRGGIAARTGRLLNRLDNGNWPVHVTPVVRQSIETIAANMPFTAGLVMRQISKPTLADRVLQLLGAQGLAIYPMLHNTCAVVGISGGEQVVATPARIVVTLGIGMLPGFSLDEVLEEIRTVIQMEFEYEVIYPGMPGPAQPNFGLYDTLSQILRESDPQGVPMPIMLTAPTDARHYNQLGIQTYGFQPVSLPPDISMEQMAHAADERIPVEALEFGTQAIYELLRRFK